MEKKEGGCNLVRSCSGLTTLSSEERVGVGTYVVAHRRRRPCHCCYFIHSTQAALKGCSSAHSEREGRGMLALANTRLHFFERGRCRRSDQSNRGSVGGLGRGNIGSLG